MALTEDRRPTHAGPGMTKMAKKRKLKNGKYIKIYRGSGGPNELRGGLDKAWIDLPGTGVAESIGMR